MLKAYQQGKEMAYQFIHVEKYAKKPPAAKKQKEGGTNWSAKDVAKEAMRVDGNCNHVINPQKPQIIFGDDPLTIVEAAEAHLDIAKDPKGRAARNDTSILISGVASYPVSTEETLNSEEEKQRYIKWRDLTLEFLKKEYGEHLKGVVEHTDEKFPHLHFYASNYTDITKTRKLYAGDTERGEALSEGKKRLGAYQDRYFEAVSVKCGLLRTGPKRKRLNRDDYLKEKEIAHKVSWVYDQIDKEYEIAKVKHQAADEALEKALAKMGDAQKEIRDAIKEKAKQLIAAHDDYKKSIDYAKSKGFAEHKEMKTTSSTKAVTDIVRDQLSRREKEKDSTFISSTTPKPNSKPH